LTKSHLYANTILKNFRGQPRTPIQRAGKKGREVKGKQERRGEERKGEGIGWREREGSIPK
jgi:hypothetical protein